MAISIEVTKRDKGNLDKVRAAGNMPAVMYGPKDDATSIAVDQRAFTKLYREAGESTVITLAGDAGNKSALIHDIAVHPVNGDILHADFYIFEEGKTMTVNVPLEFTGTAPAEKTLGGTLVKVMHELEVEVLPQDLPSEIIVDVSPVVDFDSPLHVSDLNLPSGVTPTAEPEEVVVSATPPKSDEEMEAMDEASEADVASVEVEGEKKDDEAAEETSEE